MELIEKSRVVDLFLYMRDIHFNSDVKGCKFTPEACKSAREYFDRFLSTVKDMRPLKGIGKDDPIRLLNNKQSFLIMDARLEIGEMVGVKHIHSREDLENLTKDELVILSGRIINLFLEHRHLL